MSSSQEFSTVMSEELFEVDVGASCFDRTRSAENTTGKRRATAEWYHALHGDVLLLWCYPLMEGYHAPPAGEYNVLLCSPAEDMVYTACEFCVIPVDMSESTVC
jgi:hypothetical protein